MAKRSLFQTIFGRKPRADTGYSQLQMLNGYSPVFTAWGNDPYSADIVRGAVDAIARNAAKLKPRHIRRVNAEIIPVPGQIERCLSVRPNPNMSAYDFLYKIVTMLMIDNNAFAYPVWEGSTLEAIWPINCSQAEFMEDGSRTIYVRFRFGLGEAIVLPYSDVIHLRRHFYNNDMAGAANTPINSTLSAVHTTNEGLGEAVKSSASLRGLLKMTGVLKDSDVKAMRDRFVAEYMTVANQGGIAALDAKADYVPLSSDPKMIDAPQMKELRDNVYRYFGIHENIVQGSYTEDQWNAFYESVIEPLAVQLGLELTSKLFTQREQGHGNEIIFEANRLQYASAKTKIALVKDMVPMGLLSINEAREIFNLAPVEGGDSRIVSLNYVQADKANQYQLGEEEKPDADQDTDPEANGEGN